MKRCLEMLLCLIVLGCAAGRLPSKGKPAAPVAPAAPVVGLTPFCKGLEHPGLWRENMVLADINGDGFIDFICPPTRGESEKPNIFLGDGKGGWREWTEARFPQLPLAYGGVAVGDIDGDGRLDLLLGCHSGNMRVLLQKEPGVFTEFSNGLPDATKFSSRAVRLADLTGDGKPEIIAVNEDAYFPGGMKVNPNRQRVFTIRNGQWAPIQILPEKEWPGAFGDSLDVADFDGDGKLDLITSSNVVGDKRILFLNRPEGMTATEIPAIPDAAYVFYVAAGDFDRDGRTDVACAGMIYDWSEAGRKDKNLAVRSAIYLLMNRPDGWKRVDLLSRFEGKTMRQFAGLTVADFDGNGYPDIATVSSDGPLVLLMNKDGREFVQAQSPGWIPHGRASWLGSADFNGDGIPDLFAAFGSEAAGGALMAYAIKSTPLK